MKNLANCEALDFLKQTNKIRHAVEGWLKDTQILEIRKTKPELIEITSAMSEEEKTEAEKENKDRQRKQARKNLSDMLDVALEKHAEKTLEVLALMCFIEPREANKTKPTEYLRAFTEIISNEDVIDFFVSLMRLEQINISDLPSQ